MKADFGFRADVQTGNAVGHGSLESIADDCYAWLCSHARDLAYAALPDRRPTYVSFGRTHAPIRGVIQTVCQGDEAGWEAEITFEESGEGQRPWLHVQVSAGAQLTSTTIRAGGAASAAESLTGWLLSRYRWQVDGVSLTADAYPVSDDAVAALCENIKRPRRVLPIVVVSRRERNGSRELANRLAGALLGQATVVDLLHAGVATRFTRDMSAEFSVSDGAARVFWPGFADSDSPYFHRLFATQSDIDDVVGQIRQFLVPIRAGRVVPNAVVTRLAAEHPPDPVVMYAVSVIDGPASPETEDRRPTAEVGSMEASPDIQQEPRDQHQVIDDLFHALGRAEHRIAELESENFSLRASNESRELSNVFTESVVAPFELIARARSITKLADLVRLFAETADEDAILFLDEAYESAARSPYSGNLAGPARLLATLCTVAARYHLGDMSTGEDFKRAFERAGEADFSSASSPTTLSKYRAKYERIYTVDSERTIVLLSPHLTFGSGRAHSSVKVYWYVDDVRRRFVVGQIGEHLPIAKRF